MSPVNLSAAEQIAARLSFAARRVAELEGLQAGQHVNIQHVGGLDAGKVEVDVHGCDPALMLTYRNTCEVTGEQVDGDGILRWVEVELEGVPVTFYRRG